MWTDPVVAEIQAIRQAYAARFGNDLAAMVADARAKDAADAEHIIQRSPARRTCRTRAMTDEPAADRPVADAA